MANEIRREVRIDGYTELGNYGLKNLRIYCPGQGNPAVKEPNLPNY